MSMVPMMERDRPAPCHEDWPLWYMNDFSRMGLVVSSLARAVAVLRDKGYPVREDERGVAVRIAGHGQIPVLCALLASRAVACEVSDLITCAYQG